MEKAGPENHYHYNKRLKPYARKLRKNMTKAEACLWKYVLRAGNMKKYTFNRQRPVLNYIADFMCKELLLIIEVDGISHQMEGAAEYDEKRQQELEDVGFKVLRFHNLEVLDRIATVGEVIYKCVEEREKELNIEK
jgi:very-short-patch-repair endonuclease